MTDIIGLPATGQQEILSNCNDRYIVEARASGSVDWYQFSMSSMPAAEAAEVVTRMNANNDGTVFRAVLVRDGGSLALVLPALRHVSEHHLRHREGVIAMVLEFVQQTKDGSIAVLLANALQSVPEVKAYREGVFQADELFADVEIVIDQQSGHGRVVGDSHIGGVWTRERCINFLREVYDDPTYGDSSAQGGDQ